VEVVNLGVLLSLLKALGEDSMNNLQMDVMCSPDPVDWLVKKQPGAIINNLTLACDI